MVKFWGLWLVHRESFPNTLYSILVWLNLLSSYLYIIFPILYIFSTIYKTKKWWSLNILTWGRPYTSWIMDWWSNWLASVSLWVPFCYLLSFLSCTYFQLFIIHLFQVSNLHCYGKGSLIKPFWFFDPILEPAIYNDG